MKLKEYINTYSAEPLHFIFIYVNGYFEETNGNKCLTLVLTNESKGKTKKTEELWINIRELIRSKTKFSDDYVYDKKHIRIKLNSDELYINKMVELPTMTIVVRAIFHENNKYYHQGFEFKSLWNIKMESNGELKELDIKNRVYHYFDDIINGMKINFSNTLIDKKLYKHISFNIS